MKKILFLLSVLFVLNAAAQQPDNNGVRIIPLKENISQDSLLNMFAWLKEQHRPKARLLSVIGGIKLYALPQDNMPCLVPNTSHYNMPVLGKEIKLLGMPPGAAEPQPLIPKSD